MKNKNMWLAMVAVAVVGMLTGCGKSDSATDSELSIYYSSANQKVPGYIAAYSSEYPKTKIDARKFDDIEQMDKLVINELNAGKGPDVIIFSAGNNIDALRLAKSGAFLSLDEWVEGDSTLKKEEYLPGAFEAGQVDGKQYLLPLTFRLPLIYFDQSPEIGLEKNYLISYEDFSSALNSNIERLKDDKNKGAIAFSTLVEPLLISGDAITLSSDNRKVEYDEVKLEQLMTVMQTIYKEVDKISTITSSQGGDLLSVLGQFSMVLDYDPDFIHQTWIFNNFYSSVGAENFQLSAITQGDEEVYGVLSSYGVATKDADKAAYDFLRIAMDNNPTSGKENTYSPSLNKLALQEQIKYHETATSNLRTNNGSIAMRGLPDNVAGELNSIMGKISGFKIFNTRVMNILYDTFEPFLKEEKSYGDCLTDFKQKMNVYITE